MNDGCSLLYKVGRRLDLSFTSQRVTTKQMVQIRRRRPRAFVLSFLRLIRVLLISSAVPAVFFLRGLMVARETDSIEKQPWFQPYLEVQSDFVELKHCNLSAVDEAEFHSKATPLVDTAIEALKISTDEASIEFKAELLEQFATFERLCNFSTYRPSIPAFVAERAQKTLPLSAFNNSIKVVFCISAFKDVDQLGKLVDALPTENAMVVIHLERTVSDEYHQDVLKRCPSALVLRFGSVVYRTDSLTAINIRILRWLTLELRLLYEYVVLMDGSAFPLIAPHEWETYLSESPVWLGELKHKGEQVTGSSMVAPFLHQRLIHTPTKEHKRLPGNTWKSDLDSFPWSMHLQYKSTSGNQAAYHRNVVVQLLQSNDVMELFAVSKYACCCCVEERNWIAAIAIVGFVHDALTKTSVFQLWGGGEECQGSMNNAVLSLNNSLCYRTEAVYATEMYFRGSETLSQLQAAKERGTLFARKFRSNDGDSIRLMKDIQDFMWKSSRLL